MNRQRVPDPACDTAGWMTLRTVVVIAFTAFVGFIPLAYDLHLGDLSHLIGYDDGVYMGAATQLSNGIVPYRDFVFLHPPGIILLLTPFALIGRFVGSAAANEAARVLVVLVAMVGVLLFARVVRGRTTLAMTAGLAVFALHPDFLNAAQGILLEPFLITACLLGTALVFNDDVFADEPWRWWVGGIAFGLALLIKIWAVVPIVVIVVIALCMRRRMDAARLTLACAGTFALVCAPFVALAPTSFLRYIFRDQASRSSSGSPTTLSRLGNLLYFPSSVAARHATVVVVAAVLALSIIIWSLGRTRGRHLTALEWYSFASAGLIVGAFVASGSYYSHYGAFAAVFFGLVASNTVGRLTLRPDGALDARPTRGRAMPVVVAGVVCAVALLVGHQLQVLHKSSADTLSLSQIHTVIRPGQCVATNNVSILLLSGRFSADEPGCPRVVDSFGTEVNLTGGHVDQAATSASVQQAWLSWFKRAHYVVLDETRHPRADWGQPLQGYLDAHFSLIDHVETVSIYQRVRGPART